MADVATEALNGFLGHYQGALDDVLVQRVASTKGTYALTLGTLRRLRDRAAAAEAELAKYVGWEPTVKDEYEHACAVAERAEAVVKAFEVGPRLEVNQFVADLKDALEMPGSRQPEGDAPRCSCYRSPFDHEYECPQAVVTQNGVDYPIGKQCLDRDGARWSFWGESATGEPMVKLFPFNDAYEPGLLSTVVDEHGPLAVVDALPDAKGGF